MLGMASVTRSRYLWCITLFLLCHAQMHSQVLTNALPPTNYPAASAQSGSQPESQPESQSESQPASQSRSTPTTAAAAPIPDDPSQQLLPPAKPEPLPLTGVPVHWEALRQEHAGDISTLTGEVVFYYKNYVIHADKVVYHHSTSTVEAEGHLQLEGGANDTVLTASHGEMHLEDHTARFYDVTGSFGVRRVGKTMIYSTPDPFLFTGRMLIQTGEDKSGQGIYHIVDGSMTSCRLPKPDWQIISRAIDVANGKASTHNSVFEFLHLPLFYLPFFQHNLDETGRESGIMLDGFENSSVKGLVIGEQFYWAINRSMDLTAGAQYWSKRGYYPNGDFRYKGSGLDALNVRWNGLIDRGIQEVIPPATTSTLENQGGADIIASGRKYFGPDTRIAGSIEYLSSYIYRLAFDPNLATATSSEVQSDLAYSHNFRGFIPSVSLDRFQSFAGDTGANGAPVVSVPEVRVLHLPSVRFDAVDRPLTGMTGVGGSVSPLYWGVGSSIADLARAEPHFQARDVGRFDIHPHIEWPIHLGEWQILPEFAVRTTEYSGSQIPDLAGTHFGGVPYVQHNALNRSDIEASVEVRPPALERDYTLHHSNRVLRHVIEPEIFYRYVTGINNAQQTMHFDTTDIATDTNEAGYSLTQRFYLRPLETKPCDTQHPPQKPEQTTRPSDSAKEDSTGPDTPGKETPAGCPAPAREWVSWQIAQKFFIDPTFGGALIPGRRNVFDSTLDLSGVAFLTSPRNIAPIISRLRFEAIDNLRVEWDLDYDTIAGRLSSDNLFAGYSWGRTTAGINTTLLNAVDENGSSASIIQSHLIQPFAYFGKPSDVGLSIGLNSSYDLTNGALQYGGVEAVYNWKCCGISAGYRRFALGSLRDESEWLYGFTLSGIGTAGDVRRSNSVFPTPAALKLLY
jgi:LPS-assembly protein